MNIKKKKSNNGTINILESFPFKIKRIYYLNKLRKGNKRFGHAHKKLNQICICLQGSFLIKLITKNIKTVKMNEKNNVLFLDKMTWREIEVLEDNSILLVLASEKYNKKDYIRDLSTFLKLKFN